MPINVKWRRIRESRPLRHIKFEQKILKLELIQLGKTNFYLFKNLFPSTNPFSFQGTCPDKFFKLRYLAFQ